MNQAIGHITRGLVFLFQVRELGLNDLHHPKQAAKLFHIGHEAVDGYSSNELICLGCGLINFASHVQK